MTEPAIDVPRLRKELEYVTNHPEHWRQNQWLKQTACGTVGCLAGNTVLHAGGEPLFGAGGARVDQATYARVELNGVTRNAVAVSTAARELLGLDRDQADVLFHPLNGLHRLWSLASRFTHGEIQVPPDVEPEPKDDYLSDV